MKFRMQLKKQNWKRLREEIPCRFCGQDHKSGDCHTRVTRRIREKKWQ